MNGGGGQGTLIRYICTAPAHVADAQAGGYSTLYEQAWGWCPAQITQDHEWSAVGLPLEVDETRLQWRAGRLRATHPDSG